MYCNDVLLLLCGTGACAGQCAEELLPGHARATADIRLLRGLPASSQLDRGPSLHTLRHPQETTQVQL